jgi:hypothetical protein
MNYLYILLLVMIVYITFKAPEKYEYNRAVYRYGSIDTNPMRRVSGPFDGCSPGDMSGCAINNPYEGLPLP